MGLELGPPWLFLVEGSNTLLRDNFTGAAMQRITRGRKDEPGSFAAVMHKDGRFAQHPDGRIYDPIEETKGRRGGTPTDQGHHALLTARALFRQMDGMTWEEAQEPGPGPIERFFWGIVIGGAVLPALAWIGRNYG